MTTATRLCHHETCFLLVNSEAFMSLHAVVVWNQLHTGLLSFRLFGFFFFFFFFSYDNSEVWPKSVGVEQDQLCLRLLSNPVVSMLYFPAHEGDKWEAGAGMGLCRYFLW